MKVNFKEEEGGGGGERVQEGRDHQRAESIQQQQEGVEHVHEDIRSDEEGGIQQV